ncbi:helix-turn-helix domain-containing protein [Marinobacter sp. SS21]|uniref:helix-turn-helix domain-containing protein n=1 Tax=Marinobacter sp. SS21 TaxID=2979460 RepID=UPI00232BF848|nr:AraC family transcriptional regulator [Marinobacter sp. SS21]MDC0664268.1 AraC family transcriptional regulator [Marinobacter sp. SS21]
MPLKQGGIPRRFRNATGITPVEYLQQVRIDKAKKLLISSSMAVNSVAVVAYEVGYENVGYFIRLFKGATGKTPAKWRGSHR